MAKNASIIEINGNRYDAVSGQLMGAVRKAAAQVKSPVGGVIDGLSRKPHLSRVSPVKVLSKNAEEATPKRLQYKTPTVRQRAQHSQTLMRGAVKRPALTNSGVVAGIRASKARTISVNPARAFHAKTIVKNAKVERFGKIMPSVSSTSRKVAGPKLVSGVRSASPANISAKSVAVPLPSMITSASHQQLERLLDHALINANSHQQTLRAKTKGWRRIRCAPQWLSIGSALLVVLLVGGFFAWQNIPQLSMRVASTKAHVDASVPAYTPSGYSLAGPVKASDNKVTASYKAPGNSSFAITQQASSWDSSSVAASAVPSNTQVQTSQVNGTTVYIYGNQNDAKWVNHGVLFSIQDKANLSSDQILKIANSL